MAFAAAAVTAARRRAAAPKHIPESSTSRREAYEEQERFWAQLEEQAHFRELRNLLKQYDDDRSGNLNAQELAKCIKAYSDARQWTVDPVFPTEEEVNLILNAAGKQKKNAVNASELEFALDLWHSYVTNKSKIEAIFDKYDTNHSEKLEFDQLARYLTDLNEGHAPKDAEVRAIMQEVNAVEGVNKVQLIMATSAWYTHVEEMHQHCCIIA